MARFYLIATLIVVALGSVLAAQRLARQSASSRAAAVPPPARHASPAPAGGNANVGFVTTPAPTFSGEGGWVLSALPACFDQLSSIEGSAQALATHVPPARQRIAAGTTLHRGNCTVVVRDHDIWVYRGRDRLRVPPEARLYDAKDGLTLVYEHGRAAEVRVYRRPGR